MFRVAMTFAAAFLAVLALDALPGAAQSWFAEVGVDSIFVDVDSATTPGCALSVMRDGAPVYERGYGMANLEYGIPIRDQWDLLAMGGWRWEADVGTQCDVLDVTARQTALNFRPGQRYLYSNTEFTLLAVVVGATSLFTTVHDLAAWQPTEAELRELAGVYHSAELGTEYRFEVEAGRLVFHHRKLSSQRLQPTFQDAFTRRGASAVFTRDRAGVVDGFTLSDGRVWNVRFDRVAG